MVAFTLGEDVTSNFKSPGTSAKSVAMIRSEFHKARDYVKKKSAKDQDKRPAIDLKLEMLARVLRGDVKVLYTAHKATDIMAALRVQKEFGFKRFSTGGGSYLVDEIRKPRPHPAPTMRPGGKPGSSFETHRAEAAGILSLSIGYEDTYRARIFLYEAPLPRQTDFHTKTLSPQSLSTRHASSALINALVHLKQERMPMLCCMTAIRLSTRRTYAA